MTTIVHPFTQPRETDQAWSRPRLQNVFPPTVFELGKVLKPNLITPYNPKHTLPTPPATAPARSYDATSSALVPICDTPAHELIHKIISDRGISDASGDETAFFAADLSAIYRAVQTWRASLIGSRVEIFYAVKCNPAPPVLHLLSLLGTSFDCASAAEIAQVLSLPASPSPSRIIFANPCKPASFIRAAAEKGVSMMTFDNADELFKIKRVYPSAKLVLRILTDDSKSLCRLGLKYGAPLASCPDLLLTAAQLGLDVIGVSFHVGSGCKDPMLFADAIWRAKRVFDMAKDVGYDFKFLDIGGGFEMASFLEMSQIISDSLDLYFPVETGVRVIAEPGRLMVSNGGYILQLTVSIFTEFVAFTLATNIIARRRAHQAVSAGPSVLPTEHDKGEGADVMCRLRSASHITLTQTQITSTTGCTAHSIVSSSITRSFTLTHLRFRTYRRKRNRPSLRLPMFICLSTFRYS